MPWVGLLLASIAVAGGALRNNKSLVFVAWLTPGVPPPGPFG